MKKDKIVSLFLCFLVVGFYVFIYFLLPKESIYPLTTTSLIGQVSSYKIDGNFFSFVVMDKEAVQVFYYFDSEEEKDEWLQKIEYGLEVRVHGTMELPSTATMPHAFNYQEYLYYKNIYRNFIKKSGDTDLAIAIGGDNYCYRGFAERFGVLNDMFVSHKVPCVLWGCSIDSYRIDSRLIDYLKQYHLITVRETVTYNALKEAGLKNIYFVPDTAFVLDKIECEFPDDFMASDVVGINCSPLISTYEKNKGITLANYEYLLEFILRHTAYSIALIPHVVWTHNDDRSVLKILYEKYKQSGRIIMIKDGNAMLLKGYISQCRFLIAARTHASIAGYSTQVPTLVVGYSVKSVGIASDLFGTPKNYVFPVNLLSRKEELAEAFVWLMDNEEKIRNHYAQNLSKYISGLDSINELSLF